MAKELCWLMTTRCNQECKYCHRFLNVNNLTSSMYHAVVDRLIEYHVTEITLGGGEALLVAGIDDLIHRMYTAGIKIKLVTNGMLVTDAITTSILNKLSEITFSIDSLCGEINESLGRGQDHFNTIQQALALVLSLDNPPQININSVVTKINTNELGSLAEFIRNYPIHLWRIFRFCPLRELSIKNRTLFELSDEEFNIIQETSEIAQGNCKIVFRDYAQMDSEYLLISPNADVCISSHNKDVVVGNILTDSLVQYFKN